MKMDTYEITYANPVHQEIVQASSRLNAYIEGEGRVEGWKRRRPDGYEIVEVRKITKS